MQLDVEESTPASDITYWFHSRIAIGNSHISNCYTLQDLLYFDLFSSLEFWSSDARRTQSDAYEPTVHTHSCVKKWRHAGI